MNRWMVRWMSLVMMAALVVSCAELRNPPPKAAASPQSVAARDFGGGTGLNGRRIRPRLVYCTNALDKQAAAGLGVKTDLDLRPDDECRGMVESPAGEAVRWRHVPCVEGAGLNTPEGQAAFRNCFRVFLDRTNYPIAFHGANSRALACALGALLGVEEHFPFDYAFAQYPGATLTERAEQYALACGFTRMDIEFFRSILLEPKAAPVPSPVSPAAWSTVELLRPVQRDYLALPRSQRVKRFSERGARQTLASQGWYPEPVILVSNDGTRDLPPEDIIIYETQLDGTRLPVDYVRIYRDKKGNTCAVNFKIGTVYYWRCERYVDGAAIDPLHGAVFRTSDMAPRLLQIDGVPNVRDLGGRPGWDGRRVKQGLVYRTAGLNNNAGVKYKYETKRFEKEPALKAEKAMRDAVVAECKARLKLPAEQLKPVAGGPSPEKWVVFRVPSGKPAVDYPELDGMAAIPSEFHGVKAEPAPMKNGNWNQPAQPTAPPVVLMQEFECPEAGFVRLGCGADWFWCIRVNGRKVFDLMRDGNIFGDYSAAAYTLDIPVRKGRNLIAVTVGSGSATLEWSCVLAPERDAKAALTARIAIEERQLRHAVRKASGRQAGKSRISPEMHDYLVKVLGVKSDIDLRTDGECYGMKGSPAGPEVKWFHIPSAAYAGMNTDRGKEAFARVFRVFLDERNYPIVFHCIAGQDRTGAVAFILNALLGVEEDELYRDWEATGFWNKNHWFNHRLRFNLLVKAFDKYPGGTIHERVENYVRALGFTDAEIAKFRGIMLEK